MKILAITGLALCVVAITAFINYRHKQEDVVAAFVLTKIDKEEKACRRVAEPRDCEAEQRDAAKIDYRAMGECYGTNLSRAATGIDCGEKAQTAILEWKRLYPRQAAMEEQRQDDRQRERDAKEMKAGSK